MLYPKNIKYILIFIFLILSSCLNNIEIDKSKNQRGSDSFEMDRRVVKYCEISKKRFDYRWWSYYTRGLCYAYHRNYKKAEQDFKRALSQKEGEQWDAEMYGFHYIDYFPFRELGVVLYEQATEKYKNKATEKKQKQLKAIQVQYQNAADNLEISLSKINTARAEFYLDQTRKMLIETGKYQDKKAPNIKISSPEHQKYYSSYNIIVDGIAEDDTFVNSIKIGNNKISIGVASKKVPFRTLIPIESGRNLIPIEVTDLVGNTERKVLMVFGDFIEPSIKINSISKEKENGKEFIKLSGQIYDSSGVEYMQLGEKKIRKCDSFSLKHTINKNNDYILIAKDYAGNIKYMDLSEYDNLKVINKKGLRAEIVSDYYAQSYPPHDEDNENAVSKIMNSIFIKTDILSGKHEKRLANSDKSTLLDKKEKRYVSALERDKYYTYCDSVVVGWDRNSDMMDKGYKVNVNHIDIDKNNGFSKKVELKGTEANSISIKVLHNNKIKGKRLIRIRHKEPRAKELYIYCKLKRAGKPGGGSDQSEFYEIIESEIIDDFIKPYFQNRSNNVNIITKDGDAFFNFPMILSKFRDSLQLCFQLKRERMGVQLKSVTCFIYWGDKEDKKESDHTVFIDNVGTGDIPSVAQIISAIKKNNKIQDIFNKNVPKAKGFIQEGINKDFADEFKWVSPCPNLIPKGMGLFVNKINNPIDDNSLLGPKLSNVAEAELIDYLTIGEYISKANKYEDEKSEADIEVGGIVLTLF